MRLLNINTFTFQDFNNLNDIPEYIIASHRWFDDASEPTYQDVLERRNADKRGYKKVEDLCSFVREADVEIEWVWIDTACINKGSSAELSESINSMFRWYARSECCLVYLADVNALAADRELVLEEFRTSEWFKRAWTLQELLAPKHVIFLNREWEAIGFKGKKAKKDALTTKLLGTAEMFNLTDVVEEVTGIPGEVLLSFKKAKRLAHDEKVTWLEGRRTTREEDMAYCLLGIFGIHMPLIYGEGKAAHRRLQREIEIKEAEKAHRMRTRAEERRQREELEALDNLYALKLKAAQAEEQHAVIQVPPPLSREVADGCLADVRAVAVVTTLRRIMYDKRESSPVVTLASILGKLGYQDPGETIHQAFHTTLQRSHQVFEAQSIMDDLNWTPAKANQHMINVLLQAGHSLDVASALLIEYRIFDPREFAGLEFPYIPPVEDDVSAGRVTEPESEQDIKGEQPESVAMDASLDVLAINEVTGDTECLEGKDAGIDHDSAPGMLNSSSSSSSSKLRGHGVHRKTHVEAIVEGNGSSRWTSSDGGAEEGSFDTFSNLHLFA